MITDKYNETVSVERLEVVLDEFGAPTNKKDFVSHITDILCLIQTADSEINKDITNGFGKNFTMFCPVLDIIEGDRVLRGELEYRVVGVKIYERMGANSHLELSIRIFKS